MAEGVMVFALLPQPALVVMDDELFQVRVPELSVRDPRGAGDSMTAGVVAVLAQGGDLKAAIRTGGAAGTPNATLTTVRAVAELL